MNFIGSLVLMAVSVGLLYFCRARNGETIPLFRNWFVGQLLGVAIMTLFLAGLMGVIHTWPLQVAPTDRRRRAQGRYTAG